jgi:uncharacterized protein
MEVNSIIFIGVFVLGALLLTTFALFTILLSVGLILSLIFLKTRKIIVPNIALPILSLLESPLRFILWRIHSESDIVSSMMIDLINLRYKDSYINTPYEKRMIFLPQCLRDTKCPAPLTDEGIKCINCGRCGIGMLKDEAEQRGTPLFIAPGSSLIKRMIKKYYPKAILGVGCSMEVKEGTTIISSIGLPVQGVKLLRDGCVNTRVDIEKLYELILSPPTERYNIKNHPKDLQRAKDISDRWSSQDTTQKLKIIK